MEEASEAPKPETAKENLDSYYDSGPAQSISEAKKESAKTQGLPEWKRDAREIQRLLRENQDAAFLYMKAVSEKLGEQKSSKPNIRRSNQEGGAEGETGTTTQQEVPPTPNADYIMPPVPEREWTGATLSQANQFPLNETIVKTSTSPQSETTSAPTSYNQEQIERLRSSSAKIQENMSFAKTKIERDEDAELAQLEDALLGADTAPEGINDLHRDIEDFVEELRYEEWLDSVRPPVTVPEASLAQTFEEPTITQQNAGAELGAQIASANLEIPVASEPIPSLITEATTIRAPAPEKPQGNWFTRLFRGGSSAQQTTDAPKAPPATSWERPSLVGKPPPPEPSFHA